MRVDCEKWIYTTFKENGHTEILNHTDHVLFENREKLVIEEKTILEQQLYSDTSSDNEDNKLTQKQNLIIQRGIDCIKIPNDKGLNINFEIINDVS